VYFCICVLTNLCICIHIGRHEEAKEILIHCAAVNGTPLPPFDLCVHVSLPGDAESNKVSWADFCAPDKMRITVPLWTVWFLFGLTYYGIILLTARVYQKGGGDDDGEFVCDFSYPEIFFSAASEVAGIAMTAVVIDRWGRLGSQTSLYGLAGVGVILMGMQHLLHMSEAHFTVWALIARIASMAATSVTMVITPELFTTKTRASGHSIGAVFSRFGGFTTPYLVNSSQSILFVAVVLGIANIVAMICSFTLPETKGMVNNSSSSSYGSWGSDICGSCGCGISSSSSSSSCSSTCEPFAIHLANIIWYIFTICIFSSVFC
jgi:hypothetical protein